MNGRYEFHESDWKLFSKKIIDWQENHMAELNKEYIALLSEEKDASEKFWTLHNRILNDKKSAGVQACQGALFCRTNKGLRMNDDIRIEKITGFAGAVFNESNDNSAKGPDPLHRLFESDRQQMFESAENFVWIESENNG